MSGLLAYAKSTSSIPSVMWSELQEMCRAVARPLERPETMTRGFREAKDAVARAGYIKRSDMYDPSSNLQPRLDAIVAPSFSCAGYYIKLRRGSSCL
jgi:hypothetical protein